MHYVAGDSIAEPPAFGELWCWWEVGIIAFGPARLAVSGRPVGGNELHRSVPAVLGSIGMAVSVLSRRIPEPVRGEVTRLLGLQRAFQIAGARSTITTLWAIPDQSTA